MLVAVASVELDDVVVSVVEALVVFMSVEVEVSFIINVLLVDVDVVSVEVDVESIVDVASVEVDVEVAVDVEVDVSPTLPTDAVSLIIIGVVVDT